MKQTIQWLADDYGALSLGGYKDHRRRFDASEKALKAWFEEHPEASVYATKSGLIKVSLGERVMLDAVAVKALLADELAKFQYTAKTRTISFEPFAGER